MIKIIFKDDNDKKVVFGKQISEDEHFIEIQTKDKHKFKINKNVITYIKEVDEEHNEEIQ